jgi:hypothetical protein
MLQLKPFNLYQKGMIKNEKRSAKQSRQNNSDILDNENCSNNSW